MYAAATLLSALAAVASAQLGGTVTSETQPPLRTYKCTTSGGCVSESRSVTLDSNWRWTHIKGGYTNCYTGSSWNASVCSDPKACAQNCELDGADYSATYGITTSGDSLRLKFLQTAGTGTNVGSRVYLMDGTTKYAFLRA
jgi:cellulose 1,4-beta-cellobiosidase